MVQQTQYRQGHFVVIIIKIKTQAQLRIRFIEPYTRIMNGYAESTKINLGHQQFNKPVSFRQSACVEFHIKWGQVFFDNWLTFARCLQMIHTDYTSTLGLLVSTDSAFQLARSLLIHIKLIGFNVSNNIIITHNFHDYTDDYKRIFQKKISSTNIPDSSICR